MKWSMLPCIKFKHLNRTLKNKKVCFFFNNVGMVPFNCIPLLQSKWKLFAYSSAVIYKYARTAHRNPYKQ